MELTAEQIERQDYVDNTIYNMIIDIIPTTKPIDWNIELISRIRDAVSDFVVDNNICSEQDFYPFITD